ncbi:MAG TPA: nitroreductase family protein [Bacteroidales bacterium]|nr:nitroreductase family protein [Bacteroidales bacterium]HSA43253.1 nitroreductase family protein [Bacteroidales bacterium]
MDFLELSKMRYSSRGYLPDAVEEGTLQYILECGRMAPSAANLQPWHIIVVTDRAVLAALHETYPREWFRGAPLVLVICGDHQVSWKRGDGKDHCDIDAAIITDHITLAAAEKGLGSCWICNFDAAACSSIFKLPPHIEPMILLPIGYPADSADNPRHRSRKAAGEILRRDKF